MIMERILAVDLDNPKIGDVFIDKFTGRICPVMSGYCTGKYVENSQWFGIRCLKEKCQWYGNKCPKEWNE